MNRTPLSDPERTAAPGRTGLARQVPHPADTLRPQLEQVPPPAMSALSAMSALFAMSVTSAAGGGSEGEREGRGDTGVVTTTRTQRRTRLQKPPLFKILLHNDDFTTREFVVEILQSIFHRSESEAVRIMLHVHHSGLGIAGVYTHEVAEAKVAQVTSLARENEYPLLATMEPE